MTLTSDTYHGIEANRAYVSHSQVKAWQECPSRWHAEFIAGTYKRPESDALLIGSYVDMAITQPGEFGAWRAKQDWPWAVRTKKGVTARTGELLKSAANADAMIAALEAYPEAMALLTTGTNQAIVTATIGGVPVRIMADCLCRTFQRMVDLKTCKDLDATEWNEREHERQHWIDYWSYWQQMEFYRQVIHAAEGWWASPTIVAVDKGDPPRVSMYDMGGYADASHRLAMARDRITTALSEMRHFRQLDTPPDERCGTCHYCRVTHVPQMMRWTIDEINPGGKWTAKLEG